jgi:hypothetical protein
VEKLWMEGVFPVDESPRKIYFAFSPSEIVTDAAVCALSRPASLDRCAQERRIQLSVTAAVHRFEESIAGRDYLIEVANVSKDRWRAYIVRIPGVPAALMPFYGTTPADAAHQLCEWLTRAHARAAAPSATV